MSNADNKNDSNGNNNNNSSRMTSDHTTSSERHTDNTGVSWQNYEGTKVSRDVQATQFNSKDKDGNHTFYNTKTGVQGQAGGNRNK